MTTKFYVDQNGILIGGFGDGAEPPSSAVEVPVPPDGNATWDGSSWVMPPASVPASMSFAQLMIGLVTEAWITEAEGEAWLSGTLPAAVLTVIDSLPEGQRFAAKARAIRPSEVLRADPMVAAMGAAAGKTEADIDAFFTTYAGV